MLFRVEIPLEKRGGKLIIAKSSVYESEFYEPQQQLLAHYRCLNGQFLFKESQTMKRF